MPRRNDFGFFDVAYGVSTVAITSTGLISITTTGGDYHGISMTAATTSISIVLYDAVTATTGNIVDIVTIGASGYISGDRFNAVHFRRGLTAAVTGTGGKGAILFIPKG